MDWIAFYYSFETGHLENPFRSPVTCCYYHCLGQMEWVAKIENLSVSETFFKQEKTRKDRDPVDLLLSWDWPRVSKLKERQKHFYNWVLKIEN